MQARRKRRKGEETEEECVEGVGGRDSARNARKPAENGLDGILEVDDRTLVRENGEIREIEDWEVFSQEDDVQSSYNTLLDNVNEKTETSESGEGDGEKLECESKRDMSFECEACGNMCKIEVPCNSRFKEQCPACAKQYRRRMRKRYKRKVQCMDSPKLLTLTLRKKKDPEEMTADFVELSSLFKYFRKRMRRKYGKDIKKFVWVLHPPNHVHALIDAPYIPYETVSGEWKKITGEMIEGFEGDDDYWGDLTGDERHLEEGSPIVDIRAVDNPGRGLDYIVNYMQKTQEMGFAEKGINLEAMEGVHLIDSQGLSVTEEDCAGKCPHCEVEGRLIPVPMWAFKAWLKSMKGLNDRPPPNGGGGVFSGSNN